MQGDGIFENMFLLQLLLAQKMKLFLHEAHKRDVAKVKVLGERYDISGPIGKSRCR